MTESELILNFRAALCAIVPIAEKAGVPWRRPDAYDDWDAVATALFEALVVGPLKVLRDELDGGTFALPRYDLITDVQPDSWVIQVEHPSLAVGGWIFHALGTTAEPFDTVEARHLRADTQTVEPLIVECSLRQASFRLVSIKELQP
jgi:hypothetical protein